jgi:hypothetical protein
VSARRTPVGGGGARNPNSLANLRPGAGAGDGGLQRALSHGVYAQLARQELDVEERAIYDALAADMPLLTGVDAAIVTLAAECRCQLNRARDEIRSHGALVQRGKRRGDVRSVAEYARRLRKEFDGYLDRLNASQATKATLAIDLAAAMSDGDTAALRAAGVIDGEANVA